jgi:hypothetical protein
MWRENQRTLFCAALKKMKYFCPAWGLLVFICASHEKKIETTLMLWEYYMKWFSCPGVAHFAKARYLSSFPRKQGHLFGMDCWNPNGWVHT